MKNKIIFIIAFLMSLLFGESIISGNINGATGKYPIIVNLFNEATWLKRETFKQIIIPINSVNKQFKFAVSKDDYGIIAIEDRDKNGKMSFGLFGPSEPAKVYSLDKIVFGPPDFNDFKFIVTSDIKEIVISF